MEESNALEAVRSDEVVSSKLCTEKGLTAAEAEASDCWLGLGLGDSCARLLDRCLEGVRELCLFF